MKLISSGSQVSKRKAQKIMIAGLLFIVVLFFANTVFCQVVVGEKVPHLTF
jgi:hypothetical protein